MELAIIAAIALVALGVVLIPLLRKPKTAGAPLSAEALDTEVARYRGALADKTLCDRCLTPNPKGSRYCMECGGSLT